MRKFKGTEHRCAQIGVFFLIALLASVSMSMTAIAPIFAQAEVIPDRAQLKSTSRFTQADYISDIEPDGLYCWDEAKMPLKVYIERDNSVSGFKDNFAEIVADCFDRWTRNSNGKLSWMPVDNKLEANITVRWSDSARERPEGTEAGRTKTFATLNTATNRGVIHRAEMVLVTCLPDRKLGESEMKKAYLHEVGHALGIVGHSSNRQDIMYFAVSPGQNGQLSSRDVATLNHLYRDSLPVSAASIGHAQDQLSLPRS